MNEHEVIINASAGMQRQVALDTHYHLISDPLIGAGRKPEAYFVSAGEDDARVSGGKDEPRTHASYAPRLSSPVGMTHAFSVTYKGAGGDKEGRAYIAKKVFDFIGNVNFANTHDVDAHVQEPIFTTGQVGLLI